MITSNIHVYYYFVFVIFTVIAMNVATNLGALLTNIIFLLFPPSLKLIQNNIMQRYVVLITLFCT